MVFPAACSSARRPCAGHRRSKPGSRGKRDVQIPSGPQSPLVRLVVVPPPHREEDSQLRLGIPPRRSLHPWVGIPSGNHGSAPPGGAGPALCLGVGPWATCGYVKHAEQDHLSE